MLLLSSRADISVVVFGRIFKFLFCLRLLNFTAVVKFHKEDSIYQIRIQSAVFSNFCFVWFSDGLQVLPMCI